jgi:DNA-binding MarR family transcriptional regulator/GNAT superfamily N-acetyltransferase
MIRGFNPIMAELAETVAAVRRFNRFYTRAIGALEKGYLGGPYTLAETRVLWEIANSDGVTPKAICAALDLDPGYLSRMVARFERDGLVAREPAPDDGRSVRLSLTPRGRERFGELDLRQAARVEDMVGALSPDRQARLSAALGEVQALLSQPNPQPPFELRPHRTGDLGWVVQRHAAIYNAEYGWDERFEAMCARIAADFQETFDPARERGWIAEREGRNVGCVFLEAGEDDSAKIRLLLVEPAARGLGIGGRLVDECIRFAREAGYGEITLWTQSVLTSARKIYAAAGFEIVDTWPNRDFGGWGLTSEKWRLAL